MLGIETAADQVTADMPTDSRVGFALFQLSYCSCGSSSSVTKLLTESSMG